MLKSVSDKSGAQRVLTYLANELHCAEATGYASREQIAWRGVELNTPFVHAFICCYWETITPP
jgi:hypothetical protein